jgi:uncharacterized phage protein (TIGR01671 family)
MRTIKFRGKDSNGNWHYGDLENSPIGKFCRIHEYWDNGLYESQYDVKPATIGQFTGLHDKNGKEIFEGDILRVPPKNEYEKENYVAYEVFWHGNDCASHHIGWQMNRCHFQGNICGTMYIPEFLPKETARMVVIGNIHDNPELLT